MAPKCNVDAAIKLDNDDVCRSLALRKWADMVLFLTPPPHIFEL